MLNAALAKSGALDFRWKKNIILFFAYEKGLGHMLKNSLVVVQFSFFASPLAKNNFWPDRP